jgi:hypothetical protein
LRLALAKRGRPTAFLPCLSLPRPFMEEASPACWEVLGKMRAKRHFLSFPGATLLSAGPGRDPAVGRAAGAAAIGTRGPDRAAGRVPPPPSPRRPPDLASAPAAPHGPQTARGAGCPRTPALALNAAWSPRERSSRSATADSSTTMGPRQQRREGGAGTARRSGGQLPTARTTDFAGLPGAPRPPHVEPCFPAGGGRRQCAGARGRRFPALHSTHGNGRRVLPNGPHVSRGEKGQVGWTPTPPCPGPTYACCET